MNTEEEKMLARLREGGWTEIPEFDQLRPGVRIRHSGQQWAEAVLKGTGVILHITEKMDSEWARNWGQRDIEMIVRWDEPRFGQELSHLAQYHVDVATDQGGQIANQ